MLRRVPGWLITVAIVVVAIIILAVIIAWAGGGDWHVQLGHFHWDVGVTKT